MKANVAVKLQRGIVGAWVRIGLSVAALAFVLWRFDAASLLRQAPPMSWPLLMAATCVACIQIPVAAWRWWLLLRLVGAPVAWRKVLQVGWMAYAANQVIPVGIAGDLLRYRMVAGAGPRRRVVVSLFIDRLSIHVVWMLLLAGAAIVRWGSGAAVACALTMAAAALWAVKYRRRMLSHLRLFAIGLGLAGVVSGLIGLQLWLSARGFGSAVAPGVFVSAFPYVLAMLTIPASFGGWGIREVAVLVFLAQSSGEQATWLAASVAVGVQNIVVALPAVLVWAQPHWSDARAERTGLA